MTKKEFKDRSSCHVYGKGKKKRNAIYFDWQFAEQGTGFKYMVKATVENAKLVELYQVLYDWVVNEVQPPWYVEYKYAETDMKRFKVNLMG